MSAGLFRAVLTGDDGLPEAEKAVGKRLRWRSAGGARVVLLYVRAPASAARQAEGVGLAEEENVALRARVERAAEAGRTEGARRDP